MTEQEAEDFTTSLAERYVELEKKHSHNNQLLNIWKRAIDSFPDNLKLAFGEKYNRLKREGSNEETRLE
ncbi:hypothetical protein [Paenibacillus medicaginis]|uniref:Uncharacterized protein n=1 Tax=Paenibacillus medicaginis TaxID=1470560 RepID=A0ABV5C0T9_9BACL